jgi:chaperonin cofactor prefoldin
MSDEQDDNNHFKMRLTDDIEERVIPAAVDELRMEKLSTRVTMISIMIPVLIVIVVVITYLDIKKRVVETEDFGSIGVQKLSTDLESRFSSISVRQARLEDDMTRFTENYDKTLARIEVNLKKVQDVLGDLQKSQASKKELQSSSADLSKRLDILASGVDENRTLIASLPQEVKSEIAQMKESLAAASIQMAALQDKLAVIDSRKIDKPAMDLALRLETLKIEQPLKARIEDLESKITALDKKLNQAVRPAAPAQTLQPAPKTNPLPAKPPANAIPKIQEQPLPE